MSAEFAGAGYGGGMCTELDLIEANRVALQTAIHTERGDKFGSGRCDVIGCFSRVGGPSAPAGLHDVYGLGKRIDTSRPFEVRMQVSARGAMHVSLHQRGHEVTSFDQQLGGNPQGSSLPPEAMLATRSSMGKLALVASLWSSSDLSWLDGGCGTCNLDEASFTLTNLHVPNAPQVPPSALAHQLPIDKHAAQQHTQTRMPSDRPNVGWLTPPVPPAPRGPRGFVLDFAAWPATPPPHPSSAPPPRQLRPLPHPSVAPSPRPPPLLPPSAEPQGVQGALEESRTGLTPSQAVGIVPLEHMAESDAVIMGVEGGSPHEAAGTHGASGPVLSASTVGIGAMVVTGIVLALYHRWSTSGHDANSAKSGRRRGKSRGARGASRRCEKHRATRVRTADDDDSCDEMLPEGERGASTAPKAQSHRHGQRGRRRFGMLEERGADDDDNDREAEEEWVQAAAEEDDDEEEEGSGVAAEQEEKDRGS